MQILMVQSLQLPLVFRWSMSLLCLSCRFSGAAVEKQAQMIDIMAGMGPKDSYASTQLCLAGFAGDDTARAVFPDKGLDVPVVCINCGGPQLQFIGQLVRRLWRLLEELNIFSTSMCTSIQRSILAAEIWTLFLLAVSGSCVSYRGFWMNFWCFST